MSWTAGTSGESGAGEDGGIGAENTGEKAAEAISPGFKAAGSKTAGSKRGIILILAGLVVTGVAAGYHWLKDLPK